MTRHRIQIYSFLFALILATSCATVQPVSPKTSTTMQTDFDWQGHRGARGLLPENTVAAFVHALTYPQVKTLELDLAVTKDGHLVVSHEPWMSARICSRPDGTPVEETEEEELSIYQMTLAEVQSYDCGRRGHPDFQEQRPQPARKPTLAAVVEAAEQVARDLGRPLPYYNMEIKSRPEWDTTHTPPPVEFVRHLLREIERLEISERTVIQSFDARILNVLRELAPAQPVAFLIANRDGIGENLALLDTQPAIYSPYHELCTPELIEDLHNMGILVIPWTVNDPARMQELIEMGVDGIITDYPDRIP